jgi:hypothetical protein
MSNDEAAKHVISLLTHQGNPVETVHVIPSGFPPKISLERTGTVGIVATEAFLSLPPPILEFGTYYEQFRESKINSLPKALIVIRKMVLLIFFLLLIPQSWATYIVLLMVLVWIWSEIQYTRMQSRAIFEAIDKSLALTQDPISARSYLEKKYGKLFPESASDWAGATINHPIRHYVRYGRDERMKAILRSDLVHPVSSGTSHDPE